MNNIIDEQLERFELVAESDKQKYYASSNGYILSVNKKTYSEKKLKNYLKTKRKNPPYVVKIDGREYLVKHLIAKAVLYGYKENNCCVLHKDGNKKNCAVSNLIIVPKRQVARITGPMARSSAVTVYNGQVVVVDDTYKGRAERKYDECCPALRSGRSGFKVQTEPCIAASRGRNPDNPSDRTAGIDKDNLVVEPIIFDDYNSRIPKEQSIIGTLTTNIGNQAKRKGVVVMKIGLIDVDGHNFPNLALMKISAYHKSKGDDVEWHNLFEKYDIVY